MVALDEENELLTVEAKDKTSTNVLVLSANLTTETVTSILTFGTVDTGDILLPEGVIEERKTTPKRTSTALFEARATIIRQNLEIKSLRRKLKRAEKTDGSEE